MKRLAYIYFIPYFLIAGMMTNTDMHEILKISNLVEHFKEHVAEQPRATFIDLIDMHYGSDHPQEKPDKHHDNLPFQSHHCCNTVAFYVINFLNCVDFKLFASNTTVLSFYRAQLPPQISGSIWQPPKLLV